MNDIYAKIIELKHTRGRILDNLAEVELELSNLLKNSPRRHNLLVQKEALLEQIREQNLRIKEANRAKQLARREHLVTDHALVRWLERKKGIDIQALKDEILTDAVRTALDAKAEYWSDGEMTYVLQDGLVLTIYQNPTSVTEAA